MRSRASDHFFNCILCYFANDDKIGAKKKLQSFSLDAVSFETSRQYTLLEQMLEHLEKNEKEEYQYTVNDYNNMTTFENHQNTLLVKIQENYFGKLSPMLIP